MAIIKLAPQLQSNTAMQPTCFVWPILRVGSSYRAFPVYRIGASIRTRLMAGSSFGGS